MYNFNYIFLKDLLTMNTAEMIEVMKAKENGKNIQMRPLKSKDSNDWELIHSPSWDWENFQYRVFIENIDTSYFEYLKDNTWKMTDRRYADYQIQEFVEELGAEEFKRIDALGIRTIEDTRKKD